MKITIKEIESVIDELSKAVTHSKEAIRIAKKVYGAEGEISAHLKYAYEHTRRAQRILEMNPSETD